MVPRGEGRKLWRDVTATYDLRPDEAVLLAEACRMIDELTERRGDLDGHTRRMQIRTELRRMLITLGLIDVAEASADAETDDLARARLPRSGGVAAGTPRGAGPLGAAARSRCVVVRSPPSAS